MNEEVEKHVLAWLESSGRALELRVAREMRRHGASSIRPSFMYRDPIEDVLREGDVLAYFPWRGVNDVPCWIIAVVECKSGKSEPWVAFYDRSAVQRTKLENLVYFAHGPFNALTEGLAEAWFAEAPFQDAQVATHIAAVKNGNNPASDAIRQVLSATAAQHADYLRTHHEDRRTVVLIPVVVAGAPLLTCRLSGDGDIELAEVTELSVWGHKPDGERRRVFVLSESSVPAFTNSLFELAQRAEEDARWRENQ